VRASLHLLTTAPDRISFPLLAGVYRAALGGARFSLFLSGRDHVFIYLVQAKLPRLKPFAESSSRVQLTRERRGGHALLAKSGVNEAPYEGILGRTDLPGSLPPGVEWSSFLSGFVFETFYVLMRTHPDTNASRGGMVCSQALFLPVEEAIAIDDLDPILTFLPLDTSRASTLQPIEFDSSTSLRLIDSAANITPRVRCAADAPRPHYLPNAGKHASSPTPRSREVAPWYAAISEAWCRPACGDAGVARVEWEQSLHPMSSGDYR
jgi:hypothetical protein